MPAALVDTVRSLRPAAVAALALVLLLALPGALGAYTIVLKDGSQIVAREKYRVEGDRALFTLENGTVSFVKLSEIDVARSDQANASGNLGTAVVIDAPQPPKPPPAPARGAKPPALTDYIKRNESLRTLPEARRTPDAAPGSVGRTKAGFADLYAFERSDYPELPVAAAIKAVFHRAGITEAQVHRGTTADRALVEVVTNSEAAIFRALETGAEALLEARAGAGGEKLAALELVMVTESRAHAGQFVLDAEGAEELRSKSVDTGTFFVRNVQF